ncbi:MAG: uroporphyrinogen-III synthase [Alcanivoracaceae bacterium]|jgi:uroporphyrinogen-III synthase|nr:uroporphyrinogen-III synthase [Alcanivoracaceae bacterium]
MSAEPLHILVTRPEGQQHGLVTLLAEAGFRVSQQSALSIESLHLSAAARQPLVDIDQYHAVFFVSANAARLALELLDTLWPQWPVGVHWLAVGPATADILAAAGMSVEMPASGFDSEATLRLECLRELHGKRVLICRGNGGRELMAETLRSRGAEVEQLMLYQRSCNPGFYWPSQPVDACLVTSLQGWQCIAEQVPADCRVVAPSERIAAEVRLSHAHVLLADSATDQDMLAACLALR